MNILLVTRGYPQLHNNMLGIFELDQAIALKNAGHRIAYAAVDIRSIRRKRKFGYSHFVDDSGIEVFEMNWPIGGVQQDIADYFCGKCFQKLFPHVLKEFGRPDIVHAHFLKMGTAAKNVCRKENIPLVLTEHSSYINKKELSKTVIRRALKTYEACDALIAVSHPLAANIKKMTGIDSEVIHNIVSFSNETVFMSKIPNQKNIKFVSAGNLIPRKGFDMLFRAFADALEKKPTMQLEVFGDGPERGNLEKLLKDLGIQDKVTLKGRYRKQDLPQMFSDADAFVLASRAETFGVVYIEAMALGLPVIATRCGGPEDFVEDSNGFLVEVGNIRQLSDALLRMAENSKDFDRKAIRNYSYSHFSAKTIAEQISKVYKNVLIQRGLSNHAK